MKKTFYEGTKLVAVRNGTMACDRGKVVVFRWSGSRWEKGQGRLRYESWFSWRVRESVRWGAA